MSIIRADSIKNRIGSGAPDFPNGITVTGVITATTLNSVTNNVDVDDFISVGNNIHLGNAGIVTATSFSGTTGTFSGNVSIGGTLTYEDVTNIDSVGLITARSGVITPNVDVDDFISVGSNIHLGNAGIVTATSYRGDGSQLTGITGTTINNNADNRVITGSGTANTLEGEANLTFDGTNLKNIGSGYRQLYLGSTNAGGVAIVLDGDSNGDGSGGDYASIEHDTTGNLHIRTDSPASNTSMAFSTNGSIKALFDGANGHFRPAANNTYDLGTTSYRWRNIYTQDLQLSNEANKDEGGNDVDGTWGDYTIQEGESDLYLINNRNGKKYKFNLTEVN